MILFVVASKFAYFQVVGEHQPFIKMAKDDSADDLLPDKDAAKEFYAKYEPKEILGR
jgi:hypothetical protein